MSHPVRRAAPSSAASGSRDAMKLIRDEWGVPHIGSDDEREAFRAVGYCQAEDNLAWMLDLYTVLAGRAAAAFGPGWVANDRSQHYWRHLETARTRFAQLSSEDRALYEGFIEGIQAYMDEHPKQVPEYAPA